jgi:NO-binding membrane sensor protein with MHYT domain
MQEHVSGFHLLAMHDVPLVVLSFVISVFAAYTAMNTLLKAKQATRPQIWLVGGSIAYGFGVWAMHFTGMTAMNAGGLVSYEMGLTLFSLLVAVAGSYAAFWLANSDLKTAVKALASGTVLGAGIGGMHYVGMWAMRGAFAVSFNWLWVGVSVLVAVVIGVVGMWLLITVADTSSSVQKLLIAALVGSAIPLMHYTAMVATVLERRSEGGLVISSGFTINAILVLAIVFISIPLFVSSLVGTETTAVQRSS